MQDSGWLRGAWWAEPCCSSVSDWQVCSRTLGGVLLNISLLLLLLRTISSSSWSTSSVSSPVRKSLLATEETNCFSIFQPHQSAEAPPPPTSTQTLCVCVCGWCKPRRSRVRPLVDSLHQDHRLACLRRLGDGGRAPGVGPRAPQVEEAERSFQTEALLRTGGGGGGGGASGGGGV